MIFKPVQGVMKLDLFNQGLLRAFEWNRIVLPNAVGLLMSSSARLIDAMSPPAIDVVT